MEHFLLGCRLVGSWLLVAGPLYQAVLELRDQDFRFEQMREIGKDLEPPRVSRWWWLLPPVKLVLERIQVSRYQDVILGRLNAEMRESLMAFSNKSLGWGFVAGGGLLLAINETHELVEALGLGILAFVGGCVGMLGLCVVNVIARVRRSEKFVTEGMR